MLNAFNEREQLARLHDRHKRFSLEVYDHSESEDFEALKLSKIRLKETEKELMALKKKILSKTKEIH